MKLSTQKVPKVGIGQTFFEPDFLFLSYFSKQEGASFIEACSRSDNAFIVLVAHCEQRGGDFAILGSSSVAKLWQKWPDLEQMCLKCF